MRYADRVPDAITIAVRNARASGEKTVRRTLQSECCIVGSSACGHAMRDVMRLIYCSGVVSFDVSLFGQHGCHAIGNDQRDTHGSSKPGG